jgi:hypothetical protein
MIQLIMFLQTCITSSDSTFLRFFVFLRLFNCSFLQIRNIRCISTTAEMCFLLRADRKVTFLNNELHTRVRLGEFCITHRTHPIWPHLSGPLKKKSPVGRRFKPSFTSRKQNGHNPSKGFVQHGINKLVYQGPKCLNVHGDYVGK